MDNCDFMVTLNSFRRGYEECSTYVTICPIFFNWWSM